MAAPTHLRNAPITEAVIDLRVRTSVDLDVQRFAELRLKLGQQYSSAKAITLFELGIQQPQPGAPLEGRGVLHGCIGYRYESLDGKYIAQFRRDGFTFSRLAPYTKWEEIFTEASRLYRFFVEVGSVEEVTRVATRYINRLWLPQPEAKNLSLFLTTPPRIPPKVSARLTGFLTQIQFQDLETQISGTITQTVQPAVGSLNKISVILDLDAFELKTSSPEPDQVLERFADLRSVKNKYFFASITDKTVALYK
jgi:uncharacterized protein (TIGR04255 family)